MCFYFKNFRQKYKFYDEYCLLIAGLLGPLPWPTRLQIAVGAAKGLVFLHEAEKPVIYRDFKASNILLDEVSVSLLQGWLIQSEFHTRTNFET